MKHDTASPDQFHSDLNRLQIAVELPVPRVSQYRKRIFDIIVSILIIFFCLPVMGTVWCLVRLDGGPALYRHIRVGRGGQSFGCLKFRSMAVNADVVLARQLGTDAEFAREWAERRKVTRDPRITGIGHILRVTSLDELPQLFNVLRGEMSLVGPRPVVAEELDTYYGAANRAAYCSVRPGITGLWQVTGRSNTSYVERVALDMAYVERQSFGGDLLLMLRSVPAVLQRRGAM